MKKKFKVIWEIEIDDVNTPLQAAKIALESIIEKETLTFTVVNTVTKKSTIIDLND